MSGLGEVSFYLLIFLLGWVVGTIAALRVIRDHLRSEALKEVRRIVRGAMR